MKHLLVLLICILSVEILIRLNFLSVFSSILKVTRKVINILTKRNVSDHWKEKVVPAYALRIMKYSIQMFLILLFILSLFFIADYLLNDFLYFSFSILGIGETVVCAFGYVYLRKYLIK